MNKFAFIVPLLVSISVAYAKPAQRIISLAPDITENLFSIGAGQQIVGVIQGSDYPTAAQQIPIIGSYTGIDLERIMALHPDLIVTWYYAFPRQVAAFKALGIPVYVTHPTQLEDIPALLEQLGQLTGHVQQAKVIATTFRQELSSLRSHYAITPPVSVFYQLGANSLMTINSQSWINQVITVCGGGNVFAKAFSITPEISWEALVAAHPEVIISDATNADWQAYFAPFKALPAVAKQQFLAVSPDLIERATVRILIGTRKICEFLGQIRRHSVYNN